MNKERFNLIIKIVERADKMNLMMFDRMSLIMDLEIADNEYNLRLKDLLIADNFNFGHDIVGIQNNIDRNNSKMTEYFIPRFAEN